MYAPSFSVVVSLLPCVIPPYAFRLNRVFGTKRVGWMLFGVFSLLATLQLIRSWHPFGLGISSGMTLDLLSLLIPALLLIGMAHIESLFKERLRVEQEEKRMRAELLSVAQFSDMASYSTTASRNWAIAWFSSPRSIA